MVDSLSPIEFTPGERLSATKLNQLARRSATITSQPGTMFDQSGVYQRQTSSGATATSTIIKALANGAVTAASTSFAVDNVSYAYKAGAPTGVTTVYKPDDMATARIDDDAVIYAEYDSGNSRYEMIRYQPPADVISCAVNKVGGVIATDASFPVDGVTIVSPQSATTPTVTSVQNPYGFILQDDAAVLAHYSKALGDWIAVQGECPT